MKLPLLLLAGIVGAGVASAVVVVNQSAPPTSLPRELRAHLQSDKFQIITSVRGLPLGVRDRMTQMFDSNTLDIADVGGAFRKNDSTDNATLPLRRLVAAGCAADNHCLVYYERGGTPVTRRVMIFLWSPSETKFEWGATAPEGLDTIDAVHKAVASGAITGPSTGPW